MTRLASVEVLEHRRPSTLLALWLLAAVLCASAACRAGIRPAPREVHLQDLVDGETAAGALRPRVPLATKFETKNDVQTFFAEYEFNRRKPEEHFVIAIVMAPAGRLLATASYEARTLHGPEPCLSP